MSNTQKTVAFRQQMHIGASIANEMIPIRTAKEVAKIVGISHQMVRRIECQAFYKLQKRLREIELQATLNDE